MKTETPCSPSLWRQVSVLLRKELQLEWRMKYALSGMGLYLLSVILLIYLTFETLEGRTWVLLFWMALLFAAANAVARSFLQEGEGRRMYYYLLASPQAIMLSKALYNSLLMLGLGLAGLAVYAAMTGFPPRQGWVFIGALALGAVAFALVFSMVSAIASGASQSGTLVAILGFPVLVPVLRLLSQLSLLSLEPSGLGLGREVLRGLLLLAGMDVLILALALVLFPYLWHD